MGVQRMARRHALIKKLSSVETLGSTTVICTDKTGTLTQNEMTVRDLWAGGRTYTVTGVGYAPEGDFLLDGKPIVVSSDPDVRQLLTAAALANNARVLPPGDENPQWSILGDPTEAALCVAAMKAGLDLEEIDRQQPRIRELPFESRRKRMSTIHRVGKSEVAYTKGAPREVLDLCNCIQIDGQERELDEATRNRIIAANDQYARDGLRVLAIAWRTLPPNLSRMDASKRYAQEEVERD
jgi:magnesium-transporting ATPase (P-type)